MTTQKNKNVSSHSKKRSFSPHLKNLGMNTSASQFGLSNSKKRIISQTTFMRKGKIHTKQSGFIEKKKSPAVFFNVCFDKNYLKTLIAWFLDTYGEKRTVDLVENLKQVGFHQATRAGVSLGLDDLQIPPQKATLLYQASRKMSTVSTVKMTGTLTTVEKSQQLIDTWNQTSETLREKAIHHFRTTNPVNPVYMMAFSGARGNISQVRQLVAMRGLMADPQGAIVEFPIQSNFREGLTVTEYLISCYGARKGLVDTALRTATSGYLTRRLVDAVQHVVIRISDCQTTQGILIKEKNLEQRLVGRVLLQDLELTPSLTVSKNTLISRRVAKKIASKYTKVFVRSPLTCQTEKSVCQFCYGLDLGESKLVNIGESVGIIAAQSIGEPGTQLTMRTFHTGGVGVFSEQAIKSFISPFAGNVKFLEPLPGVFVRTPHGKIAYLLKHQISDEKKPLLQLIPTEFSNEVNQYEIYQDDAPAGSLLWVKQGETVKMGQLLIQALNLETKKQKMPESSHPVLSPYSGEVFFEYMRIRETEIIKKKPSSKKVNSEKEVVPVIPTLINLGNFWIMSSFIQKETYPTKKPNFWDIFSYGKTKDPFSFFQKGDLVSNKTPIHQINIHLKSKGQLKTLNSSLIFCFFPTHLRFSKIQYSQGSYFFRPLQKPNDVVVSTPKSDQTVFTWYPLLLDVDSENQQLGYCFPLSCFELQNEKSGSDAYLWAPHTLFQFTETPQNFSVVQFSKKIQPFFIISDDVFSYSGCFQIESRQHKKLKTQLLENFLIKSRFFVLSLVSWKQKDFVKNPLQKNHKKLIISSTKQSLLGENFTLNFKEKSYLKINTLKDKWNFINTKLELVQQRLLTSFRTQIIQKKNIWFYVPEISVSKSYQSPSKSVILKPGKNFETVSFPNSYTSIQKIQSNKLLVYQTKRLDSLKNFVGDFQKQSFLEKTLIYSFNFVRNKNQNKRNFLVHPKTQFLNELSQDFYKETIKERTAESFYEINDFLNRNNKFKNFVSLQKSTEKHFFKRIRRNLTNEFCFYKKSREREWNFEVQQKQRKGVIFAFQKTNYRILPKTKTLKERWFEMTNQTKPFSVKSPLFTKQQKTQDINLIPQTGSFNSKQKVNFHVKCISSSTWSLPSEFLKIEIRMQPETQFNKIEQIHQIINLKAQRNASEFSYQLPIPEWNSFFYTKQMFQDPREFCFRTFENGLVIPEFFITQAYLKAKTLGEFHGFQKKAKQTQVSFSLGRTRDFLTFKVPFTDRVSGSETPHSDKLVSVQKSNRVSKKEKLVNRVGLHKRLGQEWAYDFTYPTSGQIVKITQDTLKLRKGVPLLASLRGLVHVLNADFVEKNQLLVTLRSKRLQTEDIVQGIPKIEQLFEARETQGGEIIQNNMHMLLHNFFRRAKRVRSNPEAVQLSIRYIQSFLVDNILQAYSNQGVSIAEKHVEVVVRQMTARVRIVEGGDTGLLPGELIQHRLIEKLNKVIEQQKGYPARYEPVILGITKSVLQSESFLLAASFQQVSKVLVQSALAKKTDFLRGLHENLLVGQLIPAGTGLLPEPKQRRKRKKQIQTESSPQLEASSLLNQVVPSENA